MAVALDGGLTIEPTKERVGVVLAASSGLGLGCADALASVGVRLVICARKRDGVDAAVASLQARGATVFGTTTDVSDPVQLAELFEFVDATFGRLDVLVINAGGPPPGRILELDDDSWHKAFDLTFMSVIRSMRHAVPRMRVNSYGRIVVLGSSNVRQPNPQIALSSALRPGVAGAVKTLAIELAREGITVNMVSPGRIATERVRMLDEHTAKFEGATYESVRARSEGTIPAGHYGKPADVGGLVAFLASEQAGYITGQSILVDGGLVSSLP